MQKRKRRTFSFTVDKSAPVGKAQTLTFAITANKSNVRTKDPSDQSCQRLERTAFLANYPNPYNPTTIISYELSKDSRVSLKIYDMYLFGREVMILADESQPAGYY